MSHAVDSQSTPFDDTLPDWPTYGWQDDVRPAMAASVTAGEPFALATLLTTSGGSPRPPGTQMLIGSRRLSGFLSGGCVEGDVIAHAQAALADGDPRRLVYGECGPNPDIRLLCGGRIEVLLEAIAADDPSIKRLLDAGSFREPIVYVTDGRRRSAGRAAGDAPPWQQSGGMFHVKRRYDPRTRLIVVGGDPTALAVASLSAVSGVDTWLVRPKGPETPPPLAGVRYDRRIASVALSEIGLDPWTAVAVATHDLEVDEDALATALPSSAFYVGVLGARRRLPERLARLEGLGVAETALARLKGPIGLDLGGKAPFEIAVAVIAEIVAARHASDSGVERLVIEPTFPAAV